MSAATTDGTQTVRMVARAAREGAATVMREVDCDTPNDWRLYYLAEALRDLADAVILREDLKALPPKDSP